MQAEVKRLTGIIGELAVGHEAERDKLAAQVEAATQRESDLIREAVKRKDDNDELRKALAVAVEIITRKAEGHIVPNHLSEWLTEACKLLARTEQAG